jgi:hypothetical protein
MQGVTSEKTSYREPNQGATCLSDELIVDRQVWNMECQNGNEWKSYQKYQATSILSREWWVGLALGKCIQGMGKLKLQGVTSEKTSYSESNQGASSLSDELIDKYGI